jgi:hypothetical protein
MSDEPDVSLELAPEEYVCPKPECRLVHWRPAGPGACDR